MPRLVELRERELLEAATSRRRARRLAEVDEMLVAAQWAVLHGEPRDVRDPMSQPGGDGTPSLREYDAPAPRTGAVVTAGECGPWVARKVDDDEADLMLSAPPTVEIYASPRSRLTVRECSGA